MALEAVGSSGSRALWRAGGVVGSRGVLPLARRGGVATWPRSRAVKSKGAEGFGGRAELSGGRNARHRWVYQLAKKWLVSSARGPARVVGQRSRLLVWPRAELAGGWSLTEPTCQIRGAGISASIRSASDF